MAAKQKAIVKLFAFGAPHKMAAPAPGGAKPAAASGNFGLQVGKPDGTLVTILGLTASGQLVDISSLATLASTSSDPTVATVVVSGMSYTITPLKAGDVTFHDVATMNDGSGVFPIDDPCTCTDPVTGISVKHGNPVAP